MTVISRICIEGRIDRIARLRAVIVRTSFLLAALATVSAGPEARAAGLAAPPKHAQPAIQSAAQLSEIVVTAQFRRQSIQNTPIAISAISASTLQARGQVSVEQIAAQAPNAVLEPAGAAFGPALDAYIRGVGQNDFNFALEPGVGMYIDGVYYSTITGSIFDLLDLDHIEIRRGPQGTLAGMNSEGGAIELFTKKPSGEGGGYLEATYGRFDLTDLRAAGQFTVVPDELFVRIAGVSRHQDGYVTRYDYACTHPGAPVASAALDQGCVLGTEGGTSYGALRAEVRWVPNDQLEVNLAADDTNDHSEAAANTLLYVGQPNGVAGTSNTTYPRFSSAPAGGVRLGTATGSPFITYSPFGPYAQDTFRHSPYVDYSTYCDPKPADGTAAYCDPAVRELSAYGFSATADYTISDNLSLKSISAYRRYYSNWTIDEDGSPLGDELVYNIVWHRQFTQELRLDGKLFAGAVHWALGGFYLDQKSHYAGRIDLGSFEFFENDLIPAKDKAVYFNVGWRIAPELELNAGARYTREQKTFEYGRLGVPGNTYPGGVPPQVASLNGVQGSFAGSKVDYRVALQYRWSRQIMTYADPVMIRQWTVKTSSPDACQGFAASPSGSSLWN